MEEFDYKNFLVENKMTRNSQLNEATNYPANLGRANNENVTKLIPLIQADINGDIKSVVDKVSKIMEEKGMGDMSIRDVSVAIGSIVYDMLD
jgi:hypothetical protein